MPIVNGFSTLLLVKARLKITTTDTADDAVLETMIEQASRMIDVISTRTFYARTETHLYDVPRGETLYIEDDDLLSITTLTNGDGVVIASTEYKLWPYNLTPKSAVALNSSSSIRWQASAAGDSYGVISIAGTWGYAAAAPKDIAGACEEIVIGLYKRRFGVNTEGAATVTGAGVVITPQDIPDGVARVLKYYQRLI